MAMHHVSFDIQTATPPDMITAALIDFSPQRPDLWPSLADKYYEVYELGETSAVVREGTGAPFNIWARERYEWSQPGVVAWDVEQSNFCSPGSGVRVAVEPATSGSGSVVHVDWRREPTTLKGRVMISMLRRNGGAGLQKYIKQGIDGLPARMIESDDIAG